MSAAGLTLEIATHQRDVLARSLGELLVAMGVTRADAPLTGSELLCAADTAILQLKDSGAPTVNETKITDAMVDAALDACNDVVGDERGAPWGEEYRRDMRAAITAALAAAVGGGL